MSKRSVFTYNINPDMKQATLDKIYSYLEINNFQPITSKNEKIYMTYPSENDFKIKGKLPECILIEGDSTTIVISAWLYAATYDISFNILHANIDYTLDNSKEVGLDGFMVLIHKRALKSKIKDIEKIINS